VAGGTGGGERRVGRGNRSWGDRGPIGYLERGKVGEIDEWDEKGRRV